jgi:RHS repeat-associated protein
LTATTAYSAAGRVTAVTDQWADLDGNGALVTRRLFGDGVDEVVARISAAGTAAWYLSDVRGSVTNVTDATGAVLDTVTYDGFGNVTAESAPSAGDRYKYTGRERDPDTRLQYNRLRWYDPATATWLSEDPLDFAAGDANLYRYVGNDATNASDPSGLINPNGQGPAGAGPLQVAADGPLAGGADYSGSVGDYGDGESAADYSGSVGDYGDDQPPTADEQVGAWAEGMLRDPGWRALNGTVVPAPLALPRTRSEQELRAEAFAQAREQWENYQAYLWEQERLEALRAGRTPPSDPGSITAETRPPAVLEANRAWRERAERRARMTLDDPPEYDPNGGLAASTWYNGAMMWGHDGTFWGLFGGDQESPGLVMRGTPRVMASRAPGRRVITGRDPDGVRQRSDQPTLFPETEAARQAWEAQQRQRLAELEQNPHLAGRTPQPGTRDTGVTRARELEVELVRRTGKGTLDWSPAEIDYIRSNGRLPPGIVGHHINSVEAFPEWAGDPRNIRFVRGQEGNLAEHGGNFQNQTTGPLIDR